MEQPATGGTAVDEAVLLWPRRVAVLLSGVAVTALALFVNGQLPTFVSSTTAWFSAVGAVECGTLSLRDLMAARCHLVGLPVGGAHPNGVLVTAAGAALARLFGLSADAAYSVTAVLLMAFAVWGVVALVARFGLGRGWGLAVGLVYLLSPIVQNLSAFGTTFWGGVLLPAAAAIGLTASERVTRGAWTWRISWLLLWGASALSMFLIDGYAAVMSQALVGGLLGWRALHAPRSVGHWGRLGAHLGIVAAAAVAYQAVVPGGGAWRGSSIDLFRAMGADVATLLVPSPTQWWAEAAPVVVDPGQLWGDGSNSSANYLGWGMLALAAAGAFLARHRRAVSGLTLVTIIALLLSLGPSLKMNAVRGPLVPPVTYQSYLMPESAATATLPSAALYEEVPGLTAMRATYRWQVLVRLGLSVLAAVALAELARRAPRSVMVTAGVVGALAVAEISPDLPASVDANAVRASMVADFDHDVVEPMRTAIPPNSRVVFAPNAVGENDFLANYLAPRLRIHTYNVGGDKALEQSRAAWPAPVTDLLLGDSLFSESAEAVLASGYADIVVVPFFDLRWSAYSWPSPAQFVEPGKAAAAAAAEDPDLVVEMYEHFAVVTLPSVNG